MATSGKDRFNRFAHTTTPSRADVRPTTTADMECEATDHIQAPVSVKDIAERMLAHHTDGTVIATAEVLGLDLSQLWEHFVQHTDPTILQRSTDPVVLAYLTVKGFEDWCMEQLAESYSNTEEEP